MSKDNQQIIIDSLMARIRELEEESKVKDIAINQAVDFIKNIDNEYAENRGYWEAYRNRKEKIRQFSDYVKESTIDLKDDDEISANSKLAYNAEKYLDTIIAKHTDWQKSILNTYTFNTKELKGISEELTDNGIYYIYDAVVMDDNKINKLSCLAREKLEDFLAKNNLHLKMTDIEIRNLLNE